MNRKISRRVFSQLVTGSAALAAMPAGAMLPKAGTGEVQAGGTGFSVRQYPQGFLWGSATASYQVEGAVKEDGRGPSIWDTFSHTPGKTDQGDTGDVADDFYHLYKQDIAMMKELGLRCFRFSVSWSRVFPSGTGKANPKGLDFYNKLVDTLLEAGIQPFCTLFHWDLPQALEDRGGWQDRRTAEAFGMYAGHVAKHLSDRVSHFMTLNEMRSFVDIGYRDGRHAPGLKLTQAAVAQVAHHAVLAHGLGVQAIRANAKTGTLVGIADNATAICPVIETEEHVAAAAKAMREENAMYLSVILDGKYSDLYLKRLGDGAPKFTDEDLKAIGSPMDFVGLNVYSPEYVRADESEKGYAVVQRPKSFPHMESPWLAVGPEALYWSPKLVDRLWKPKALYITENGASAADVVGADGHVWDIDRTMYLRNYLTQLHRAVNEGVPVKGYFCWSLLDNYEWADGYAKRFGIVYVDFKTQKRTLKLSAEFYKATIAANAVA